MARVEENRITFARPLAGEDRVYLVMRGFGPEAKDYDLRIDQRGVGAGVRITADRPLARLALWAIRAPLSIEPFIDLTVAPGEEVAWRITYEYYTLAREPRH